ncbi:MAG: 4-hydroxythreonine-4-phosphate dehydrogenase PdxA [Candidatus Omnitrophota bacterium]|nr:MAG: 4-hydroxythreonine-4-phosphate dehydrogenase PdxA [Candidatus Omnitrophota bacterium]
MQVVITIGDPAGCGPSITLGAIEQLKRTKADFFVVGDQKILKRFSLYKKLMRRIHLIDAQTPKIGTVKNGYPSLLSGRASLSYLAKALRVVRTMNIKRLITAPISKEAVQQIQPHFKGHTEYLARHFDVENFAMMMVSRKIKIVLFTRHIPLRTAPSHIHKNSLLRVFSLVHDSLQKIFKLSHPKIAVASFNPHAGINTFLDREERILQNACKVFKKTLYGPLPADTLFTKDNLRYYDCIIALYHDQGMIPFKLLSFKEGVNLTVGLPIIRTSPAHGVAYDVMKRNRKPFSSSMVEAIKLAMRLNI